MSLSIALSGKGGTGKTTLAGILIKYLIKNKMTPVLAVDADANYNLNEVLGIEVETTLGEVREQMKHGKVPSGMTKDRFMATKLEEAIEETDNLDMVVMGQPEGQGCYCAANTLLSDFLEKLNSNYDYIVMDNEAGMEHISRLTTSNIDCLLVVADPSRRGIQAAERIKDLTKSLNIGVDNIYLILNNLKQEPNQKLQQMIQDAGLELLDYIFEDEQVQEFDLSGKPTFYLPEDNPFVQKAYAISERIFS